MNNKFYFTISDINKEVQLPIEIKWDFNGREDSIDEYQTQVLEELIGLPDDFEISRFSHSDFPPDGQTKIKYDFYFYSGNPVFINTSTVNNWVTSYIAEGFTPAEIYYFTNPFTKSFFKLDFYDTNDNRTQRNLFTVVLPVQQGGIQTASVSPQPPFDNVLIKTPTYELDFVGDKEGFFLYWLRNTKFLKITDLYMTAKFFDGKTGVFVKMMNVPQSSLSNKFNFDQSKYFYYKVKLDYDNKTYKIFNSSNTRIGTTTPIKWYEYVNPPQ